MVYDGFLKKNGKTKYLEASTTDFEHFIGFQGFDGLKHQFGHVTAGCGNDSPSFGRRKWFEPATSYAGNAPQRATKTALTARVIVIRLVNDSSHWRVFVCHTNEHGDMVKVT